MRETKQRVVCDQLTTVKRKIQKDFLDRKKIISCFFYEGMEENELSNFPDFLAGQMT